MSDTTIYEYNACRYYTGNNRVIGPMEGIPPNWADAPLPSIPDGQFAVFTGVGWELTDQPFVPPYVPPPEPPVFPPVPPTSTTGTADPTSQITVL
jgi:hypothetical protein